MNLWSIEVLTHLKKDAHIRRSCAVFLLYSFLEFMLFISWLKIFSCIFVFFLISYPRLLPGLPVSLPAVLETELHFSFNQGFKILEIGIIFFGFYLKR